MSANNNDGWRPVPGQECFSLSEKYAAWADYKTLKRPVFISVPLVVI